MQHINDLFSRFKRIAVPNEGVRKSVVDVCARECNVTLQLSEVSVRDGVVYITASPHAKMTIYTKKKRVLEHLRAELGSEAPIDVR